MSSTTSPSTTTTGTTVTSATTGAVWELVIGLEVHCELATATKIFCSCPNHFGDQPNTNVCPICLGLPGSLPVLNEQAVDYAIRIGRALNCDVHPSVFARKNYFYPDMPKDYQVSQYDQPINADGHLDLADGSTVGIERAHMEEDTGKNTHAGQSGRIHGSEYSLIDYNRAGVPLVEIVSRPDLRSGDQAKIYVAELRQILLATGASDAKMEEGSMRVDANLSVRPVGVTELGTRCEVKNLNSLRSLGRAIDYEAARQVDLIEAGQRVKQETRHWDEEAGLTRSGRSKEEAEDYRYFQEPDLVPLAPSAEWLARVDAELPALPAQRRRQLATVAGLEPYHPGVVVAVDRHLDDLAAGAIDRGADAQRVLTHVEHNLAVEGADQLDPARLAELVGLELEGKLSATQAKTVLAEMVSGGGRPADIAADHGFEALDANVLEGVLADIRAGKPDVWDEFVSLPDGDKKLKKLKSVFTGEIMKATKGQADGKVVNALLDQERSHARAGS
jgi:aspartyl-tRNA(Asn)/glutamyl-tRNA(Gln) amidotransferase subunit B